MECNNSGAVLLLKIYLVFFLYTYFPLPCCVFYLKLLLLHPFSDCPCSNTRKSIVKTLDMPTLWELACPRAPLGWQAGPGSAPDDHRGTSLESIMVLTLPHMLLHMFLLNMTSLGQNCREGWCQWRQLCRRGCSTAPWAAAACYRPQPASSGRRCGQGP